MVLKMYSAPWCKVCQPLKERYLGKEFMGEPIVILDIEKDERGQDDAMKYGIVSVPVFVIEEDGMLTDRHNGPLDERGIEKMVRTAKERMAYGGLV